MAAAVSTARSTSTVSSMSLSNSTVLSVIFFIPPYYQYERMFIQS